MHCGRFAFDAAHQRHANSGLSRIMHPVRTDCGYRQGGLPLSSGTSRKVFLGVLAIFVSFGLTGASAYVLSSFSGNRSEAQLSALVRFFLSPLIAAITGALVGALSTDRPLYSTIVGLAPWAVMFLSSPTRPDPLDLLTQAALVILYVGIGAVVALFIWKVRTKQT